MKTIDDFLPERPAFDRQTLERVQAMQDARPILFEWLKHTGMLAHSVACIRRSSPTCPSISARNFGLLVGLLHRCGRLIGSILRVSHDGRYGETMNAISRCVSESAIKLSWLAHKNSDESYRRYMADGLKYDVRLKADIQRNISERGGSTQVIEKRMLLSIDRCIAEAGLCEADVLSIPRLPDLASMYRDLGFSDGVYTANQRMGSHAVHGSWPELLFHYIEQNAGGEYDLVDAVCQPHANQFAMTSRVVLFGIENFVNLVCTSEHARRQILDHVESVEGAVLEALDLSMKGDFDLVV